MAEKNTKKLIQHDKKFIHEMYPEVIPRGDEPKEWTVRNGWPPTVDTKNRKLKVPLVDYTCPCGANHADAMRMASYGHLAWTPEDTEIQAKAYGDNIVQSKYRKDIEQARVLQRMAHNVYDDIDNPVCLMSLRTQFLRHLSTQDVEGIITTMIQANATAKGSDVARDFIKQMKRDMPLIFPYVAFVQDAIKTHIHKQGYKGTYEDTLDLCFRLEDVEQNMEEMFEAIASMEAEEAPEDVTEKEMATKEWGHAVPPITETDARWMTMRIEKAPLTLKAAIKPTRKWTARDEGVVPAAIHRLAVDGRIFHQPVHKDHGYNLLIDCSGSMHWSPEHLREVLMKAPATRVALYSGDNDHGVLRIVSEKGMRAVDHFVRPPSGGNNGVDGPALRWLAKQKGLKIWLSDGGVTGIGDGSSTTLFEDASQVVKKGRIMQTFTPEETIAVIKGEQPWRWKPARRK